jgi:Ca2+-binding EF-hand superfamily protein
MRWSVAPAVLVALMVAVSASGQQPPPAEPQSAFKKADKNDDGHLDRVEFLSAQTEVFFFVDADKNGNVTLVEIRRLYPLTQGDFDAADRDRDGKLPMDEFLGAVSKDFDGADKDHNGKISFEEFLGSMQAK